MRFLPILALGALVGASHLQAALVMTIDPTTKQFWLTGTATGKTSSLGRVVWSTGNSSAQSLSGANLSVVTTSPLLTLNSIWLSRDPEGIGSTFALFFNQVNRDTTITGAGDTQKVYYGGMSAYSITQFETGIGKTMTNTESSTSFGSITVVPEPSSASLLMAGIGGLVALRLRRRRGAV